MQVSVKKPVRATTCLSPEERKSGKCDVMMAKRGHLC